MRYTKLFYLLLFFVMATDAVPIKVLYTSALIKDSDGSRKACYVRNLKNLKKYGCEVYVVESCQRGPTYLDKYCENVCYTRSNDLLQSKSYNEVCSMLIGLTTFNFHPEDMIIKVTGRYVLEDDKFIQFVKNNLDADIIARIWSGCDAYTGYYAIKQKHLMKLFDHFFYMYENVSQNYAVEHALGNFINMNQNNLKIKAIPKLYDYSSAPQNK